MKRVAVAVSGPGEASAEEIATARELGKAIGGRGWVLLTGGRDAGVMAAATAAASAAGGFTIGLLPTAGSARAADLDVAIVTDLGSGRNNVLALSGDVVVAVGASGSGTLSEIALAVKAGKPVIVVGADAAARTFLGRFSSIAFVADAAEAMAAVERIVGEG
ncbi:MAG TPA: cytochrome [Thermoanaerobaculia bacterium]